MRCGHFVQTQVSKVFCGYVTLFQRQHGHLLLDYFIDTTDILLVKDSSGIHFIFVDRVGDFEGELYVPVIGL